MRKYVIAALAAAGLPLTGEPLERVAHDRRPEAEPLGDLLGQMRVTPEGFARMTKRLRRLAHGRVVLALEGGYNLRAIARSAAACMSVLQGEEPIEEPP